MPEIVEEIPLADGGRLLIYDDGSQQTVRGTEIIYSEGPMSRDRGMTWSEMMEAMRGTQPRHSVDPDSPGDLQWLRDQIASGNTFRESRPTRSTPPDQYLIVADHGGWGYTIGRRTHLTFAQRISGRLGATPVYDSAKYLWGVRGSEAARAAWRRDFARAHPGTSMLTSAETETALADTGISPQAVELLRGTGEFSLADLPGALMMISRAALEADERIPSHFQRFVAQYNRHGFAGSIVAILAGAVEFVARFVVGIVALPAAIEMLYDEAENILQAIQEALPDILQALQEAPLETMRHLLQIALSTLSELTGLRDIRDQLVTGVDVASEGRDAESSLHIIRATTRVLELLTIVRGLVSGLRRLPAIARRLRTQLQRINQLLPRLRAARAALRRGSSAAGAVEDMGEAGTRARRGADSSTDTPETTDHSRPRSEVDEVADDLGVDDAISEDAPYGARESVDPHRAGRVRTRRADGSSTRLDVERRALHRLQTEILTAEQLRAARRFVGQRLNSHFRQLWRSLMRQIDRDDLAEIRRLLRRAERETSPGVRRALREGAYEIARERLYPRMASRFWTAVHDQERFAHIFRDAGLQLRRGRVPAWILPDGTEVRLSLEHLTRVSDNPLFCIDPNNLSIVPLAENSDLLEAIRAIARFGDFAGAH